MFHPAMGKRKRKLWQEAATTVGRHVQPEWNAVKGERYTSVEVVEYLQQSGKSNAFLPEFVAGRF